MRILLEGKQSKRATSQAMKKFTTMRQPFVLAVLAVARNYLLWHLLFFRYFCMVFGSLIIWSSQEVNIFLRVSRQIKCLEGVFLHFENRVFCHCLERISWWGWCRGQFGRISATKNVVLSHHELIGPGHYDPPSNLGLDFSQPTTTSWCPTSLPWAIFVHNQPRHEICQKKFTRPGFWAKNFTY